MKVATGTVVNGKVVVEGETLAEGETVTVLLREASETFELTPEEEGELRGGPGELDSFSRKLGAALRVKPPAKLAAI